MGRRDHRHADQAAHGRSIACGMLERSVSKLRFVSLFLGACRPKDTMPFATHLRLPYRTGVTHDNGNDGYGI